MWTQELFVLSLHSLHCMLHVYVYLQKSFKSPSQLNLCHHHLITDDGNRKQGELIQDFVDWYQWSCLIDVCKTKELVMDFRRFKPPSPSRVNIQGKEYKIIDSCKYQQTGLVRQHEQDLWKEDRTDSCKEHYWQYFLTVVAPTMFYCRVCWGRSISMAGRAFTLCCQVRGIVHNGFQLG